MWVFLAIIRFLMRFRKHERRRNWKKAESRWKMSQSNRKRAEMQKWLTRTRSSMPKLDWTRMDPRWVKNYRSVFEQKLFSPFGWTSDSSKSSQKRRKRRERRRTSLDWFWKDSAQGRNSWLTRRKAGRERNNLPKRLDCTLEINEALKLSYKFSLSLECLEKFLETSWAAC